jgi:cytochrome P450
MPNACAADPGMIPVDMVTIAELTENPHPVLARLRSNGPVAWVPALEAWVVTGRAVAVEVMRDAETFTVDDPRFSTGRVVGRSMLSTDGPMHARHRDAFAAAFRPALTRQRLGGVVTAIADRRVADVRSAATVDLRAVVAGPVAAEVAIDALGLIDTAPADVLRWYAEIASAVSALSIDLDAAADDSLMDGVRRAVERTVAVDETALAETRAAADLTDAEFASNVAIVLFGALETSEAMIANLLRDIVVDPDLHARLAADPATRDRAIDESLRLEPGASYLDRYVVETTERFGVSFAVGDHVIVSLAGANRDPTTHRRPHEFLLERDGEPPHLTFATGPHVCLGAHLARMEARAVLDAWFASKIRAVRAASGFDAPTGLVFRKPDRLRVEVGSR